MDSLKIKMTVCTGPVSAGPYIFMLRPSLKKLGTTKPQETMTFSEDGNQSVNLRCLIRDFTAHLHDWKQRT